MRWFGSGDDSGGERLWRAYLEADHVRFLVEERLREADEERAEIRERLLGADVVPVLRESLRAGRGSLAVLNLLRDVGADRPDVVHALLPELYACCLSVNKAGIWGREVVRTLAGSVALHDDLAPSVDRTLRDEVTDVFAMRALVMLLDDIGDTALMARWRRAALASPDVDVRDIAEEYPADEGAGGPAAADGE
ncbi:hypothetical protein M2271_000254 [Streptomyces sp. LBL]|uniref:hypothetical protein n=1 Tax=Streptomyces sp. LBL TaxID=2940562 RepID=UPI002476DA01|nr:hypothetical protein [Streptomyces sp. LBL]MDH6622467.1 hypothetical protein [Streptomyces sp. LBL]